MATSNLPQLPDSGQIPTQAEIHAAAQSTKATKETNQLVHRRKSNNQMAKLPYAVRDIAPGIGFTRLNGTDGRDGFHTGGAWLSPDHKEVWKPLDARPYANADFHTRTLELDVLTYMKGEPCFPRNWRVETVQRGDLRRQFLVRSKAYVYGTDECPWSYLKMTDVFKVEQAVRKLNSHYWALGDPITLALDRDYNLFLLDLSAAWVEGPPLPVDDEWRILRWLEEIGLNWLAKLRRDAREVCFPARTLGLFGEWPGPEWEHVYASRLRPLSRIWASKLPDTAHILPANYDETKVHTWIVVPEPLSDDILYDYELTWGWSPIPYINGRHGNREIEAD